MLALPPPHTLFDSFRAQRGRGLPEWPAWCYCPMAGAYAVVSRGDPCPITDLGAMLDVSALSAMAAWRMTKGIYRYDPDIYQALITTPLSGDLPSEVLYRLPEWCLYLETPGPPFLEETIQGAWVHLEWDMNTARHELRIDLQKVTL
ncbi:MAG: hypothetical protein HQL63_08090 [Magnetococcales bacterium]|nr:hypothetical protein [Magnetococcales bacterium]